MKKTENFKPEDWWNKYIQNKLNNPWELLTLLIFIFLLAIFFRK
jgi:hypothetical protein